jgi:putative salt-induced outer membrane protein YdiY
MPGATYVLILLYALAQPVLSVQPPVVAPDPAEPARPPITQQPLGQELPTPTPEPPVERQEAVEEPDRWAAAVDLGFASSSGNSDLTSLTTGIRLRHLQTKLFKLEWSLTFRYGESQGDVVARNLQSKLDFDVGPSARVAPFVFAAAERDPFRKLDLRTRTGSGVKYTFYREQPGEASVRVAAQYSRETFTSAAAQDVRTDGAWSMELKGNRGLGENIKVENTTTFAPVFDDFSDHNIDIASKISSKISRHLALTLTHAYGYDSTPADGVGRTDQRFQAGLTIDF